MNYNKQEKNPLGCYSRRNFLRESVAFSSFFIIPRHVLGKGFIPPSDKITLGFIGAGKQSLELKSNFLDRTQDTQIVAVCDVDQIKMDGFSAQVNAFYAARGSSNTKSCTTYKDYRELLIRSDVDAIVIATPDHWHAVLVVKSAAAGKDIYCEKPLSLTIQEGRMMVKAVRRYNKILQTGSMQRSWPEFRQTVELVRNGYIGEIQSVKVNVGGPPVAYNLSGETVPSNLNWDMWLGPTEFNLYNHLIAPPINVDYYSKWREYREFGGGGMTDWGAHMFDIVQWALDMDNKGPVSVIPPNNKDIQYLTYHYDNGVVMTRELFGDSLPGIQFNGTKGKIEVQRGKIISEPANLSTKSFNPGEIRVYYSDNHYSNFIKSVKNRKSPICDVETGHRTATVCNIGNIAYAVNKPLTWDFVNEKFDDPEANRLLKRNMRKEYSIS